jgi:hypothetical protein
MLTSMTDEDWTIVLRVFEASRSRRGDKGRDDKRAINCEQTDMVGSYGDRQYPINA